MGRPLKILILGHGRMGTAVANEAGLRGHHVEGLWGRKDMDAAVWPNVDVAVEFTLPESAPAVFSACRNQQIPLVSGTTGWLDQFEAVQSAVCQAQHPMVWSPNYSVGVHLFRKALRHVSKTLEGNGFESRVSETHHTGKVDAPSGTALAIAKDIGSDEREVPIEAIRLPGVPGTHRAIWDGAVDVISVEHAAKDRSGFARGAVLAAEWLAMHKGPFTKIFGMDDVWG